MKIIKRARLICSVSLVLFSISIAVFQQGPDAADISDSDIRVIETAELFFTSIRDRQYNSAWELLSEDSRERIIEDSYDASRSMGVDITREAIENNFNKSGIIFQAWWDSFVQSFDANMILEESHWRIGYVKKQKAEIVLTYRKSKDPAILKMYKEGPSWKVGFAETFLNRRY